MPGLTGLRATFARLAAERLGSPPEAPGAARLGRGAAQRVDGARQAAAPKAAAPAGSAPAAVSVAEARATV